MGKLNLNAKIFVVHRWLGLLCGLILLLVGLTGSVVVFTDELKAQQFSRFASPPSGPRLPLETLFARARQARPDIWPNGISLRPRQADQPVEMYYERSGEYGFLLVNPYTGNIVAELNGWQVLPSWVLRLHYQLLIRLGGDLIVALSGLLFLGSALTGVWIYRRALIAPFRRGVRFRSGIRHLFADLHVLTGIGALFFNLALGITGVYMMLYAFSPRYLSRAMQTQQRVIVRPTGMLPVDELLARAKLAMPGFEPQSLYLPSRAGGSVNVYGNMPGTSLWLGGRSSGRSHVYLNASSGAVLAAVNIRDANFKSRMEAVFYELHFGQFGGLTVKVIYAMGGLTPGILSITGFFLWLKRRHGSHVEDLVQTRFAVQESLSR